MKNFSISFCLLPVFLISLTAACSTATLAPPSSTPAPTLPVTIVPLSLPTATSILPPTAAPAAETAGMFIDIHMMDSASGWGWAATPDGVYHILHTADGGRTWKDVTPKDYPAVYSNSFYLDADTAWVPLTNASANANILEQTQDGGNTWKIANSNTPFANAILHFQDLKFGWALAADRGAGNVYFQVFETHDSGGSWSQVSLMAPKSESSAVEKTIHLCNICGDSFYYDPQRVLIASGDMGSMQPSGSVRLMVSNDRGKNWRSLNLELPKRFHDGLITPFAPTFLDEKNGLLPVRIQKFNDDGSMAYQVDAFYRTADGGLSWLPAGSAVENANSAESPEFLSMQDVFLRCGSRLCVSHDGMQTWQNIVSNLNFDANSADAYVSGFHFLDPQTGWAIVTSSDTSKIYQTKDGGSNWIPLDPQVIP